MLHDDGIEWRTTLELIAAIGSAQPRARRRARPPVKDGPHERDAGGDGTPRPEAPVAGTDSHGGA